MPEFIARVGTTDGTIAERSFTADSEGALRAQLQEREYLIFGIRRKSALSTLVPDIRSKRRIRMKEFLLFNQELAALLRAGLPIIASLAILLERRKNPVFRRVLIDVHDRVRGGASLSEAFDAQGEMFPKIFSSTLASGERSGEVATVLQRYIVYQKTMLDLRRKVTQALIYPICLFVVLVAIIATLILHVIPKFVSFFEDVGAELPLITRVLIGVSHLVTENIWYVAGGLVAAAVAFRSWQHTESGRLALDRLKVGVPVMGGVWHRFSATRFVRTLGTLIGGGIPAVTALGISARAVGNRAFELRLLEVERKVREGRSLWESLEETGLFSDIAIEMTRVGESTGALDEMLVNIADFYDEEIDARLSTMMALLEPVMLIIMGGIVATMMLAIFLPMVGAIGQGTF
ncbi:MAG: type II secretion system F family protein [Acidobacteriota bacterium]